MEYRSEYNSMEYNKIERTDGLVSLIPFQIM